MSITVGEGSRKDPLENHLYQKGVKHMYENGIHQIPNKYILPANERPDNISPKFTGCPDADTESLKLPIIDFAELLGPYRARALESLAHACETYGFFQLVNHGIEEGIVADMVDVGRRFFEMPIAEREKYMSADLSSPVRYGTSFNQTNDGVFSWRDFLKLVSDNNNNAAWPSSPADFRQSAGTYAKETRKLFLSVMEAIMESLGISNTKNEQTELENGSQLMVVNCYPPCPQPDLTLGMPPHSDYGFLTLLLQDTVRGLQIQHRDEWFTVQPIPGAFVVNVGDHLEIFSNGRYKSVLHRVIVNSSHYRISVASLHSVAFTDMVRPAPELITEANPRQYRDTDFASFLQYIKSCDSKKKNFLQSRKIELVGN